MAEIMKTRKHSHVQVLEMVYQTFSHSTSEQHSQGPSYPVRTITLVTLDHVMSHDNGHTHLYNVHVASRRGQGVGNGKDDVLLLEIG